MKIITLDILKKCGVCDDAYKWASKTFANEFAKHGFIYYDYGKEKLMEYVKNNPNTTEKWVDWYNHLPFRRTYIRLTKEING